MEVTQVDLVENGLSGGYHGSRKTRMEVIVMTVARDDSSSLIYNMRMMVRTAWRCCEN